MANSKKEKGSIFLSPLKDFPFVYASIIILSLKGLLIFQPVFPPPQESKTFCSNEFLVGLTFVDKMCVFFFLVSLSNLKFPVSEEKTFNFTSNSVLKIYL